MARIFSTEKLSLNGDNIRIQSTGVNKFDITDSNNSVLISRDSIEDAHSSLHTQDAEYASSLTAVDVEGNSSLNAQDIEFASSLTAVDVEGNSSLKAQDIEFASSLTAVDVEGNSSLNAQDAEYASSLTAVDAEGNSSLNAQDIENTSSLMAEINSTNNSIESNDVVAVEGTPGSGDGSLYIDFGARVFESNALPSVSVTMQNGTTGDPIIGAMITDIATTGVTVTFSDDLPSADYKVKILASI
jgi:hypothetical protein